MKLLIFGLYSYWLPQIVFSVKNDTAHPLKPQFIISMAVTRLILPLYLYGCPANLLRVSPSPVVCVGLIAWTAMQVKGFL